MTEVTSLADRYLNDLGRMLDGMDPAERAEVLQSVREHIDGAVADLGRPAGEADMHRILGDLGPAAQVAEQAWQDRAGARPGVSGQPAPAVRPAPALARGWVPPVVALSLIIGSFFALGLVPLVLLIGGIVLLCLSPLWSLRQRIIGAVAIPMLVLPAPLAAVVLYQVEVGGDTSTPTIWAVLAPLAIASGLAIGIWLWVVGARVSTRLTAAGASATP